MSGLYDTDLLDWSEQQAALLGRVAAGERVNGTGLPQHHRGGRERLTRAAARGQVAAAPGPAASPEGEAWRQSRHRAHWLSEARVGRINAGDRFAPAMRQRIDVARICAKAMLEMPDSVGDEPPLPVSAMCPSTLDAPLTGA